MNGRPYRGMSAEERLAERRERLISAAYILYSDIGFPETTIERLCAAARISNRAFYECFSGRNELMRAVHDRCVHETLQSVAKSIEQATDTLTTRVEAGISGYINFVTEDRRRARIMHLEVRRAGDCLVSSRQLAVTAFTDMIELNVADLPEAVKANRHLLALGMIGAIQELLIEWVLADDPPSTESMISTAVHFFYRLFTA
ncbi:TetR/AcrR family transcriptional regulator [Streptosporangium sp. NBC_01755]|uniref:TetR/AcrR family transcriptional regulator n=1 Tax=unclassified Streptosporangium TaxID=2632669 RepID=UPI002DDA590C|nr:MULTISPECIES: TetR/AcrR family transcriptional regulator [unclassified Streptosporangium]WSA23902.1 TetR/AcrR family transcriptional regulator [Streptosporangium sp. NBC_01810]WSC98023.1 TetR/AcrR family transcriptional regulator [Streptosporangium sp. NBC_01755]